MACFDDLNEAQDKICTILDDYGLTPCEGAAILGALLAKICISDVEKSLYYYASCMGTFSKTLEANMGKSEENFESIDN